MEDHELAPREGLLDRLLARLRARREEDPLFADEPQIRPPHAYSRPQTPYHITIRRQVMTFADAVAAADGLKRGEQQILNLCSADATLRERIKDFLAGVNYAQEGTWEEIGEHVYLLAPSHAIVETAPATPRITVTTN
ncbi:MAG: cell division protein SepF [Fimbriimonadales bacterium]|nr:cell division protein SepF [Fimbriimonadales bacterium]